MNYRFFKVAGLLGLLGLVTATQMPVAEASYPPPPILGIGLKYRDPSHGLEKDKTATVTVKQLVRGSWKTVYGPRNHTQGFSIQVPADEATYKVSGTYVDRKKQKWSDEEITTVKRNRGYVALVFGQR